MIPTITVEEVTGSGMALLRAVTAGRPRQVRLLLDAGAPVDQTDECGQSALIKAVFIENPRNRLKIIQLLLRSGATVSRSDVVGRNALSWACYYARDKTVEMCIRHRDVDLDLNMSDINGCTPLFHAATAGSAACVKNIIDILCKYALSVDVPNFNGITPLMQALRLGHDVCASILVHQGNASTTVRDANFLSALDWAERVRGSVQKSSSKKSGFLPIIPTSTEKGEPSSRKQTSRSRFHGVSTSISDDDNDSSYDSSTDSYWMDVISDTGSGCSSKSCTTRSSPTVTFGRTPINSPKLGDRHESGDEDFDYDSAPVDIPERPSKSQIKKNNHDLPQLYTMLSDQLSQTYKPGCKQVSVPRPGTPDFSHDENCNLECCRDSSPVSSRSLTSIRLPEERIQNMVAANRRSSTAEATGKRSKGSSLRKKLAQKQLATSLHPVNGRDADDTRDPAGFPSIPEGRLSLVSSASNFVRNSRSKEMDRVFSGKGFRL